MPHLALKYRRFRAWILLWIFIAGALLRTMNMVCNWLKNYLLFPRVHFLHSFAFHGLLNNYWLILFLVKNPLQSDTLIFINFIFYNNRLSIFMSFILALCFLLRDFHNDFIFLLFAILLLPFFMIFNRLHYNSFVPWLHSLYFVYLYFTFLLDDWLSWRLPYSPIFIIFA